MSKSTSPTDLGAIRDQAIQKMRDAWKNSTGDVPQVSATGVSGQAAAAPSAPASTETMRTDAICDGAKRVAAWSRELFRNATGKVLP